MRTVLVRSSLATGACATVGGVLPVGAASTLTAALMKRGCGPGRGGSAAPSSRRATVAWHAGCLIGVVAIAITVCVKIAGTREDESTTEV